VKDQLTDIYEIRKTYRKNLLRLEIYRYKGKGKPIFLGGIHGTPFRLIEHRLIKGFSRLKIDWTSQETKNYRITEGIANTNALLFRALAPMKNIEKIRSVAEGISEMREEEAAYWMGMVLHRKKPSRILAALRLILTTP
jgi:hypothetical protein